MKNNLFGMSLIEYIVVIATISIISSVSVNGYRKYVQKSRTVEILSSTKQFLDSVSKFYNINGNFPSGCPSGSVSFDALNYPLITSARWCSDRIEIFVNTNIIPGAGNNIIEITPLISGNRIDWQCGTSSSPANEFNCDLLPSSCKNNC